MLSRNLVVDVGNTLVKVGVFEGELCVKIYKEEKENTGKLLEDIFGEWSVFAAVVFISVVIVPDAIISWLGSRSNIFFVTPGAKLPFQNHYATPHTLGVDRIALVAGAQKKHPQKNVLIVSMGTCITYDYLDLKGIYRGGAISPGVQMRLRSLSECTAGLPLVPLEVPENFFGNTTKQAILSGVVMGLIDEIEGAIARYKSEVNEIVVIGTGGTYSFFAKQLKSLIFAEPNLLLEGGNALLKYNLNEV